MHCFKIFWIFFILAIFGKTFTQVGGNSGNLSVVEELLSMKNKNLNIALNLTGKSGVKIDQRSAWVGLGLSLDLPYIQRIPVARVPLPCVTMKKNTNCVARSSGRALECVRESSSRR
ncbi:MAG: hypothetical protein GF398_11510 [Chitinivibrionales bacterium]|nr:hypothetical protein [Chitinivibrionales bacterium]